MLAPNTTATDTDLPGSKTLVVNSSDVKVVGVSPTSPVSVAFNLTLGENGLHWAMEVFHRDRDDVVALFAVEEEWVTGLIEGLITQARMVELPADLRFLHPVMEHRSAEERRREGIIFELDHAVSSRRCTSGGWHS